MNEKRIFIGSFIHSAKLYDFFEEIKNEFKYTGNIKFTAVPNNLHITFRFIGNTPVNKIKKIQKILNRFLNKEKHIHLEITGLKTFSRKGKPSILYAAVNDISGELEKLQKQTDILLEKNKIIKPTTNKFIPHITFARIKNVNKNFFELTEYYKKYDIIEIKKIKPEIIESILKPSGAVYQTISSNK